MKRTLPVLVLLLLGATCGQGGGGGAGPPESPVSALNLAPVALPAEFGLRAYRHVAEVVGYGPRFTGSPGWRKSVDYIAATLERVTGRKPVRDHWTDPDHHLEFENVSLILPGKSEDRVLLACHHDTKKTEGHPDPKHNFLFLGANDSGSGVGLLLALAEELAGAELEASVQLAFFDGEESIPYKWDIEQALFGSKRFVAKLEERRKRGATTDVRAMVLLDMVGDRDLQIDEETMSTPGLVDVFRAAAAACGHADVFFQDRQVVTDDHVPFLDAGIPAIDLIDLIDNPTWHTADDTLEHISPDSLRTVGEVVLTALPEIVRRYVTDREPPAAGGAKKH